MNFKSLKLDPRADENLPPTLKKKKLKAKVAFDSPCENFHHKIFNIQIAKNRKFLLFVKAY